MTARLTLTLLAAAILAFGQRRSGEVRVQVTDPAGLPLLATVELVSRATDVARALETASEGTTTFRLVPFGPYILTAHAPQFTPLQKTVEIHSEVPQSIQMQLSVAPVDTAIVVSETGTLLDPHRIGTPFFLGSDATHYRRAATASRSVLELVEMQPGWLLEAHGVLHPRGSEYSTQYVIDGIPFTDNRSPGFAPPLEVEEIDSLVTMTGNYPAEYGRKLGGVVEVTTARDASPGWSGKAMIQGGSFGTVNGYAGTHYVRGKSAAFLAVHGARTDRYLDPPSLENYSNTGANAGLSARYERDWNEKDRTRWIFHRRELHFLVPNEPLQQVAGQRQDRNASETAGQFMWSHVFGPSVLANTRLMVRDFDAGLWSNPFSTPIEAYQDRGFREVYTNFNLAGTYGNHEWKAGGEWIRAAVREWFRYRITDPHRFDDDVTPAFEFNARDRSREASAYVQDLIRAGNLSFSLGLRWDRYRFLVRDSSLSPRLGVAWSLPRAGLFFRASWDRIFETPAAENLLLASSASAAEGLSGESLILPIEPSRANFWQAGFSKTLSRFARLDGTWYRRGIRNYFDDEVLLNTGISFPISFHRARIEGFEGKLEIPRWGRFSGFLSWSNLSGTGEAPISGGLFLEADEAEELLEGRSAFRVSQDQRTTVQARGRYHLHTRLWSAFGLRYGSGLPVELEGDPDISNVHPRILARVDLDQGRVRPSWFLDAALGGDLLRRERTALRFQADVTNLTDRLNVVNFAGLFSGNAIAAPRAFSLRLTAEF